MADEARKPHRSVTADLREETAALLLSLSGGSDVIALAADLLAKGHNSQPLLALASLYPSATSADVVVLISTVLTEAGDPPLDRESDEFPLLALRGRVPTFPGRRARSTRVHLLGAHQHRARRP